MIRVFVGSHKRFVRCEPVIKYSIEKYASKPVDIIWLRPDIFGLPDTGCTGFSLMRYEIPRICNHQGHAIYLDVDMILKADIAELWDKFRLEQNTAVLLDGSNEVMVINCEKGGHIPAIPLEWNVEDYSATKDDLETAKLIHFTDLKTQPWFHKHPKGWLAQQWFDMEAEALEKDKKPV